MRFSWNSRQVDERDYWKKVADSEFDGMDDEAKHQWEDLRRITR